MPMNKTQHTTCQICERRIKANTGLIAHHGYKRPGHGWQTASCYGARHVPYEVGHDALDRWIKDLRSWIARDEALLTKLMAEPPPTYIYQRRDWAFHYPVGELHTYERPSDFDTAAAAASDRPTIIRSYATLFRDEVRSRQRDLPGMRSELSRSQKRREEWSELAMAA